MPTFTVRELARRVNGTVEGDGSRQISGVASIEAAGPADVTYLSSSHYRSALADTEAGAVVVPDSYRPGEDGPAPRNASLVRVPRADLAFREIVRLYRPERRPAPGVAEEAAVHSEARLGDEVSVAPFAVIEGDVEVGRGTTIGPHTVLRSGARIGADCRVADGCTVGGSCRVGDRVVLHSGVRVGAEGFGYADPEDGSLPVKMPQVGGCVIEDEVEIGANSTVDRGSLGDTVIGAGTKIDNLVHVGHNVRVGRGCLIVAQVGVAGSTELGDGVQVGGQAGISGHLTVGDGARIGAQAGVIGDVPPGADYSGYPARPHRKALRASAALFRLPELLERLRVLEERVEQGEPGAERGNG